MVPTYLLAPTAVSKNGHKLLCIIRTNMKPEKIHPDDWLRILVGEVPATYFIELIIRAAVVYLILMVSMRLMGKRMSSQLSRNELAALVSLAAAVGIPMMSPDR